MKYKYLLILLLLFCSQAFSKKKIGQPDNREVQILLPEKYWELPLAGDYFTLNGKVHLKLPKNVKVYTQRINYSFNRDRVIYVDAEKIEKVSVADGVCASDSAESAAQQNRIIDKATKDSDVMEALGVTQGGTFFSHLRNSDPLKIAYGLSSCAGDGDSEEELKVNDLSAQAIFFHDGFRIILYLPQIPLSHEIIEKKLPEVLKNFDKDKEYESSYQRWKFFKSIVEEISISKK